MTATANTTTTTTTTSTTTTTTTTATTTSTTTTNTTSSSASFSVYISFTGTTFMSETLNDVLSLQKIEDGQLTLEMNLFKPDVLFKSALSTFK
jgi:anti-sigma28 factor (negative regulator of flagellin synthesis)